MDPGSPHGWCTGLALRKVALAVAVCALTRAAPARAVEAGISDGGMFFSEEALSEAEDIIRAIRQSYGRDVVVETYAAVPEDLKAEPWTGERAGAPAKVFEVEPLGGYTVVTLSAGEEKLRVLMRGQPRIEVDSPVALSCDPKRVHFFEPDGQALAPQQTGT